MREDLGGEGGVAKQQFLVASGNCLLICQLATLGKCASRPCFRADLIPAGEDDLILQHPSSFVRAVERSGVESLDLK